MYADKSRVCTKVDVEREAEVEHLVLQHATQLTFLNDCSFSVNGGDAIPPCHRKTNTIPYRGGGEGGGRGGGGGGGGGDNIVPQAGTIALAGSLSLGFLRYFKNLGINFQ